MTPRTIEEIRERATELSNNRSRLVQRQTELEQRIDHLWQEEWKESECLITEDAVEAVEEALEEVEEDLQWTEHTLEALEWVLGETDVRPEIVTKAERMMNEEIHGIQDSASSSAEK